jgi:hypothetical protein
VPAFSYKALDVATSPTTGALQYGINGVNVAANMASSLESLGVLPKNGPGHDASEITKGAAAATGLKGARADIITGIGELMGAIRL